MRVWRISTHVDLSGRGGILADGRWNRIGTPIVYCSDHPATSLLEMLVRIDRFDAPTGFRLLTIELPDDAPRLRLDPAELPPEWRMDIEVTRSLGTDLLQRAEHLFTLVPCVLVPFASNVLLNSNHPDVARCSIVDVTDSTFDPRFIR